MTKECLLWQNIRYVNKEVKIIRVTRYIPLVFTRVHALFLMGLFCSLDFCVVKHYIIVDHCLSFCPYILAIVLSVFRVVSSDYPWFTPVSSQESGRSCICVLGVPVLCWGYRCCVGVPVLCWGYRCCVGGTGVASFYITLHCTINFVPFFS